MKIIKHLLSHTGLIVIIVFTLAVIYFRAELLPDNINKPIDTAVNEISNVVGFEIPKYIPEPEPEVEVATEQTVSEPQVEAESTTAESESESMVASITNAVTETVDSLFSSESEETAETVVEESETATAADNEVASNDSQAEESTSIVSAITNTVKDTVEEVTDFVAPGSDSENSEYNKLLVHARQAYWNGDLREAETAYQELTKQEDMDPDAYGELGNVYYVQGKWQQAGQAYYEAAVRLIDLKKTHQVNYLLRVIQGLDAESAEKLQQKMQG